MMKNLTLTFGMLVLTTFIGLSAAQGRKAGAEPAVLPPPPNMITLSATPNVLSKKGCPVTARPQHSGNAALIYPNRAMTFVPANAVLSPPPAQWKTDATGKLKITIKFGQTVKATIQTGTTTVTSNSFACTSNDSPS
jgi:hypothetical protein